MITYAIERNEEASGGWKTSISKVIPVVWDCEVSNMSIVKHGSI
jgi:hypothetical protein